MACMKLGSKIDAFQRQGQAWFCTTGLPTDIVVQVEEMSFHLHKVIKLLFNCTIPCFIIDNLLFYPVLKFKCWESDFIATVRFCTTGLPTDIVVQVEEMSFHLHKFPLLSRSGVMERMLDKVLADGNEICVIKLEDLPAGAKTFELVCKFCYGVKLELTASNVVYLRCAAQHLEMTEEYGEGNLISQTEMFLNQVVLRSWKDSLKALQSCDDILSYADQLNITKRCIESLAMRASTDPNLFGWPIMEHGGVMQSPGGSVLWNGISTGARPKNSSPDWWYEDASSLSFPLFKRLITAMESHGIDLKVIAGSVTFYAKKYLPGLIRHQGPSESNTRLAAAASRAPLSEEDQKLLVEEIDGILPMQKSLVSTKLLFGLLRTSMILKASPSCISNLEKRIGMQLDQASLEDLLMPNFSYSLETLYNVDCVERIIEHFLAMDQATGGASFCSADGGQLMGSPSLTPLTMVAKLIDGYLAEVAPDVSLKLPKFQTVAALVPEYARPLDDGLYRATDIYLKSHPWLQESEREQLCRLMDCQKLSLEACTHAAQNERLPLRVVVQVLFFEQLQLRSSIAGCILASDNLDGSRQLRSGFMSNEVGTTATSEGGGGWATAVRENQVLKVGMDSMRMRVMELEKECTSMRQEIEKLAKVKDSSISSTWGNVSKKFGLKLKSNMCSAQEGSITSQKNDVCSNKGGRKAIEKNGKHKKSLDHL